jgi:hypothetical protein
MVTLLSVLGFVGKEDCGVGNGEVTLGGFFLFGVQII